MRHLKTELELLKKKLLSLSSLVEKSLDMVIIALKNKDEEALMRYFANNGFFPTSTSDKKDDRDVQDASYEVVDDDKK